MTASEKQDSAILPVSRSKDQARQLYNRISKLYDFAAGTFERRYIRKGLECLAIKNGQSVLEIGFGSGYSLKFIAEEVTSQGKAYGIDISQGMLEVARRRLKKARLTDRVELCLGDAVQLPYSDNTFDKAFMSFTLELFDTPEIPKVLNEVQRVLKPDGKLGVVSISRSYGKPVILRLYEWAHQRWPRYFDCRPIYVEQSLREVGYKIQPKQKAQLVGLPLEIIIATKSPIKVTT